MRAEPSGPKPPGSLPPEDEVAIVLRAKRDLPALEPVYRAYYPRILAYCRRRLPDAEDAADATSQTFTKAVAGIDGFTGGTVAPWLFTIARHVVIDIVRARRAHIDLDTIGEIVERSAGPEEQTVQGDQRRALATAMRQLTPEQREVVELRLVGLAGQEIADVLGLSLSAVKSSQFRAYTRLRTLLADEHIFGEAP